MCLIWSGSISSLSCTGSRPPTTAATRPTCTPRSLTFALLSMTRPDRSDTRVTGTVDFRVPVNNAYVSQIEAIRSTSRISVHQPGCSPSFFLASAMVLPGQVEVAGLPVYGQRNHHHHERRDDQRGADRAPDGLANSRRPTA